MNARKSVFQILAILAILFATVFSPVGVAAQDSNFADWNNPQWADEFASGSRNAVFSTANPLPKESDLPQAVKDALAHGMVAVLVEPWRVGCPEPLNDVNCNVGYVKSFYDWDKLYDAVYKSVEANKGHVGPWTDGSVHLTRLPEVAAGLATQADWGMFTNGDLRITFAENQLLPDQDPTAGAKSFRLIEPWRHTCIGSNSSDPDCNVGKSGVFPDWQSLKDYLSEGGWTRGSVMAQDKVSDAGGNLPQPGADDPYVQPNVPVEHFTIDLTWFFNLFNFVKWSILFGWIFMAFVMLASFGLWLWSVIVMWRVHWLWGLAAAISGFLFPVIVPIAWLILHKFAVTTWPVPAR